MNLEEESLFSRVMHWINDRWPLKAMIRLGLEEDMPGGDSFVYIFDGSVLANFLIQVITKREVNL